MSTVVGWVIRHRYASVLVIIAATIVFGFFALRIPVNTDFVTYLSEDSDVVREFHRAGDVFGSNYLAMVIYEPQEGTDLFSRQSLSTIRAVTKRYAGLSGVTRVLSLTNAMDVKDTPFGISIGDLIDGDLPVDTAGYDDLKRYVAGKDLYRGVLVDERSRATLLLLTFDPDADHMALAQRVIESTRSAAGGLEGFSFGGMPFVMHAMSTGIVNNLTLLVPLILLVLIGILSFSFRSVSGVLFPLLVVTVSAVWAVGILSMLGVPLDILTGIMPVILIAMGSADGIHLMHQYSEERRKGSEAAIAVRDAVGKLGLPIILTSLTTMVGFASLVVSDFAIIRTFGLSVTLAIFLALMVTLFFLPPLAAIFGSKTKSKSAPTGISKTDAAMGKLADFVYYRRRSVLAAAGILATVALIGIPLIVVNVDWSLCLAKDSNPYRAEMLLRERFGGSLPFQLSIKGNIKDPAVLLAMQEMQSYAESRPLIGNARSVADLLSEMNFVLNGRYAVPETEEGVANLWILLEGEDRLDQFVGPDDREALVQARVESMATADLRVSTESMEAYLRSVPRSMVVVDRRLLDDRGAARLRAMQGSRVALRIAGAVPAFADRYGRIEEIVSSDRLTIDRNMVRITAADAVRSYLDGEFAEVPVSSEEQSRKVGAILADVVAAGGGNEVPSVDEIVRLIGPEFRTAEQEEVFWLADSLSFTLRDAVRYAKVDAAVEDLRAELGGIDPGSSEEKRVRGALQELAHDLAVVSERQFYSARNLLEPGRIRMVPIEVTLTGMVPVLTEMERQLMPTQIKSVGITLAAILLLLILVFRSVKIGIAAVVPTILTILTNFAVLGYAGIGLDSFTAVIASVVIGLGIDYAIHLISRFRREVERLGNDREALRITFRTTGVAILINALSVGVGFEILNFAAGQHLRLFGSLLGLSLIASALYTLLVLPVLLMAAGVSSQKTHIIQR